MTLEAIRIAICDTNPAELETCANICRSICAKKQVPVLLATFSNGQALLFEMMDQAFASMVSILILEPFNGCEVIADSLRQNGYDGIILYLSWATEKEYFYQAFDVSAFNYVEKNGMARFSKVLEAALDAAREQERQYIAVSCAGEYRQIELHDIYYFETSLDHMVCVWYKDGKFIFQSSLSKLEKRLEGRGFMRVHRSYLVALDAVHRISYDQATLVNGSSIPLSRGTYPALKEALEKWR